MTINAPAAILLAMYIAVAENQGVASEKLRGTIQNDILKEYTARGTYIFPPRPSIRLITDIFAFCKDMFPCGTPSTLAGTTCVRPVVRPSRKSPLPFPMPSHTSRPVLTPAWTSTALPPGSAGSSTPTTRFSKRWPSTVQPERSGPTFCVTGSRRKTRAPGCCVFTPRLRASA